MSASSWQGSKVDIEPSLSYRLRFTVRGALQPYTLRDGWVFHVVPTGAVWVELKVIVSLLRKCVAGKRLLNLYRLVLMLQRRHPCERADGSSALVLYTIDLTHKYRRCGVGDSWEYSSGEWVQTAIELQDIWQAAPCLPANWVLMNHWFGMLHVPCDC